MHRLFVYGTLQHPPLLEHLLGRAPVPRPATLRAWRASRLRGRVYPGLVPADAASARGHLIEVTDDELAILDRFEGSQYGRIAVQVETDGREVEAVAWRLREDHVALALGDDWDLEAFVTNDAHAFLGASRPGEEHPWAPA